MSTLSRMNHFELELQKMGKPSRTDLGNGRFLLPKNHHDLREMYPEFYIYETFYRGEDWIAQKKKCYKRDNYTCRKCGKKEGKLDAHHIIPFRISKNNKLYNLLTVCPSCHKKMDHQYSRIGFTRFLQKIISENIKMEVNLHENSVAKQQFSQ